MISVNVMLRLYSEYEQQLSEMFSMSFIKLRSFKVKTRLDDFAKA